MLDANSLPYYPRFIFNCNNGKCLSTGDLTQFRFIKERDTTYNITAFRPGDEIEITWEEEDGAIETDIYTINRIEIHEIKYDLDEPTYGMNSNDCTGTIGREKRWMMDIYIFLEITN